MTYFAPKSLRRVLASLVVFLSIVKDVTGFSIPTWTALENQVPSVGGAARPSVFDSALKYPMKPDFSEERPTLFRERHGWCPFSERVFLALEYKGIEYDTVLIDNTGPGRKPDWYGGNTPQIRWAGKSDSRQSESMDIVRELDSRYPDTPSLYDFNDVDRYISSFRNTFPRGARPSSRAAFLFSWNGEPLFKKEFERVLLDTDQLLGETQGSFFCGKKFSAADVAWAPFLERYAAQLPCLHDGLDPRDERKYPNLVSWYKAMDEIPSYICRVKGNNSSWRKVLRMAGFGNSGTPPAISSRMDDADSFDIASAIVYDAEEIWSKYSKIRPFVAFSASAEAASILVANRKAIELDLSKNANLKLKNLEPDKLDETLRLLAHVLITGDDTIIMSNEYVKELATFLDTRMCVPRDMGSLSAAVIKRLSA